MLRRWLPKRHIIACAVGGSRRLQSDVPGDPESIRELIRHAEQTQLEKEAVVDSRKVVFSCGASADHRPRIAAAEAFDIAAAALPRPPNFCYVNISVDFSAMLDAPEVVWFNLCKANQLSPSAVEPNQLHLLGGAVCQQRLGGGYIQVMLGCIPDLESDVFTFDAIPEAEDLHQSSRPPPVLCVASLDTKLALQYNQLLSTHIQTLASRLAPTCPLIGGLYPSLSMEDADSSVDDAESKDLNDSMFFINDRIFKGSAVATVLRSNLLQAKSLSVVPSISIGTGRIDKISVSEDLVYTIESINGSPATTVIRDLYTSDDMKDKVSKVFLGVAHEEMVIPVAFSGYPEEGVLRCSLPLE